MKKKRAPRKAKPCDCVAKVDDALAKQNERLIVSLNLFVGESRAIVMTERLDPTKKTKRHTMVASFCPFCGKEYFTRKALRERKALAEAK